MEYKLEDVCEFIRNGANIKQSENAGGYPITRIETIANSFVDVERMGYANIEELEKYEDYLLVEGDILMSHINSEKHLGKTAIFENISEEVIHGMNLLCLRPDKEIVVPKYLNYYFNNIIFRNKLPKITKKSVNQASFSVSDLKKIQIDLPLKSKQENIVQVLDKAKELIDKRKDQIKALDVLVKSRFIEMFGDPILNPKEWGKAKLGEVCFKITDGEHQNPEFVNSGIPMVMANNIRDKVDLTECKYISEENYMKFSKKCRPEVGDVLLVSRGATIGRCCENRETTTFSLMGSVILLKNNKDIVESKFLVNWFKNEGISKVIYTTSSASAQQAIYMKDLKEKSIILPPIKLQQQFAAFVNQVDKLKFAMEKSLEELENNFNSLMQKAFKGELFN
jgi:type I restriction enzyme S subunit